MKAGAIPVAVVAVSRDWQSRSELLGRLSAASGQQFARDSSAVFAGRNPVSGDMYLVRSASGTVTHIFKTTGVK